MPDLAVTRVNYQAGPFVLLAFAVLGRCDEHEYFLSIDCSDNSQYTIYSQCKENMAGMSCYYGSIERVIVVYSTLIDRAQAWLQSSSETL